MQQPITHTLTDLKTAAKAPSSAPCCPLHQALPQQQRQRRHSQSQQARASSMVNMAAAVLEKLPVVPDAQGRFGKFGGRYVPETLIFALTELEQAYQSATEDPEFQVCNLNILTTARQRPFLQTFSDEQSQSEHHQGCCRPSLPES